METDEPEQPTAMQRLENAEREVNRMSGDIASLLQVGHQQQQQFQQQQQQVQHQQQQLGLIVQLLTNLTPAALPAGPAPAALPASPAPVSAHQSSSSQSAHQPSTRVICPSHCSRCFCPRTQDWKPRAVQRRFNPGPAIPD
ncbi:probable E3 ubiquitin-protein ligase IRF2BPL [Scomber scombrus]|uniref:Probable E3 ubiquitin-protein ligase IRF2BPL n=1 Tax=Scomber scombrus TaxID=13677 RepID=A0AAV1PYN8_SCOSC